MKITLFIPNLIGCGAERVMVNLANYLQLSGNDVTMLNYRYCESPYELDSNIKRHFLYKSEHKENFFDKCWQYFFTKSYYRFHEKRRLNKLKRFIKSHNTDCYLVMLEQSTIDFLKLRDYICCPIIVSERNYPENYREKTKTQLFRLARLADGFVFQTEAARRCYGDSVKNSTIIPNAVNKDFMNLTPFSGEKRKTIVNIGRLEDQKNQKLLIEAFAAADIKDYTLEIYGDGPLKSDLQNLILSLDLKDKVFLKGHVPNVKEHIADASIFVLSSDYEGIPNVLLEAMALGLPLVTTDFAGGGAHILIEDGENGLIVPKGDAKQLSSAIKELTENKALCNRFIDNSLKKIRQFYPENIYPKWEEYIKSIVKRAQNNWH